MLQVLGHVRPSWALWACALNSLLVVGLALRWRIFLRAQGFQLPVWTILGLTWAGQFYNLVLPGSTGGDVVKIYQVCRLNPDRKAAAAATVLVDRLTALFALLILATAGLIVNPLPLSVLHFPTPFIGRTAYLVFIALVFSVVLAPFLFRAIRGTVWGGRLLRTITAAKNSFTFDGGSFTAFLLALTMHLLMVLIGYLFARALGMDVSYLQILVMLPVIALFVMLPITINGHGLRELLLIGYFTKMGSSLTSLDLTNVRETAIAFSLLMVTNDLLWALPGGILYIARVKSPRPNAFATP
jgi:uncharacterized membrane protein YbhN (UPF0104 family)